MKIKGGVRTVIANVFRITVLGSTPVVKQLLFSNFSSILPFEFDLIFGSFFTFWGNNGLFLGSG